MKTSIGVESAATCIGSPFRAATINCIAVQQWPHNDDDDDGAWYGERPVPLLVTVRLMLGGDEGSMPLS